MNEALYPALKKLLTSPEWAEYKKYIDDKSKLLFAQFKTAKPEDLKEIQTRMQVYGEVTERLETDLKDFEFNHKEKNK